MPSPFRVFFCLLLLASLIAAPQSLAQDSKPMAMSEVSSLLKAGVPTDAVLEVMAKRGVRFKYTSTAERQLKKFGFNDNQLAIIKRLTKGEKVNLEEEAKKNEEQGEGDPANEEAQGKYPIGYPNSGGWHAAEKRRMERAIANAGLGYKRYAFTRFTLYCNERRAAQLVPMLRQLEKKLIDTFPESIPNAISEKSAHIVIVDGVSEWNNWLSALEAAHKQDGINLGGMKGQTFVESFKDSSGVLMQTISVCNANVRFEDESVGRFAAYSVGYLMMQQAGGKKDKPDGEEEPDGLLTGFGNYTETLAFNSPSVMVYSYEKRELKGNNAWKAEVVKRFKDKQITDVTDPWGYTTSDMKFEHYAECWSYVSMLVQAPKKFAESVCRVREDKQPMSPAVRESYGLTDRKLLEIWYKSLGQ